MAIEIFISHASKDAELARRLVSLLCAAINLEKGVIRCTSVDGYRLPAGVHTSSTIRQEIATAPVVIGILSKSSMASAYVLFELGARWGQGKYLVPVLGPGFEASELAGPITDLSALRTESRSQVAQLLEEVAAELGRPLNEPKRYQGEIELVTTFEQQAPLESVYQVSEEVPKRAPSEEEASVLRAVASSSAGFWGNPSAADLASKLDLPAYEVEHVLEVLEQLHLVGREESIQGTAFFVTRFGRAALVGESKTKRTQPRI